MAHLAAVGEFDRTTFLESHWDRRPVLYRAVHPPPFVEHEVFAAAVTAKPANIRFTIERRRQSLANPPGPADTSFDTYERRLADQLGEQRYSLTVTELVDSPLWTRCRDFFAGLPADGMSATMIHGTDEPGASPDSFAAFTFGVRGLKQIRLVSEDQRIAAAVGPGDLLYWPASYSLAGGGSGTTPTTTVQVTILAEGSRG